VEQIENRGASYKERGRILREPAPAMCEVEGVWPDALDLLEQGFIRLPKVEKMAKRLIASVSHT
jgi:hypothetical protein